ncbi:MAG: tRNA (adenosine(37)-N6)-dimethylallyltransferase MiaA [Ferruginibacter sp.]
MAAQNILPHIKGKTCIIVAGPTAVGKTAFAIKIARHYNTQIISADSRQCFKELDIGVAKPSPEELAAVPHHFISSHSVQEEMNASLFESYALQKASGIFKSNDVVVMAGGTGLYIKAFTEGMDEVPVVDPATRDTIISQYEEKGMVWLQQQVAEHDPFYFAKGEIQNPQRLMRALEVIQGTGRSILSFQKQQKKQRDFSIIKFGLELPREVLYQHVNQRVEVMMKNGLLDEVKSLLPFKNLNALQTVGYRELFDYLGGKTDLARAVELIRQNTRHYAKRQLTWFKKDPEWQWVTPHHPL